MGAPTSVAPLLAFDLMDTVVVDPFFREVPRLLGRPVEELFAHRDRSAWPAFERNEIDEQTFMQRFYVEGVPEGMPTAEEVRQTIQRNYRFVDQMPALLARLHDAGAELWVFSNYPVWFDVIRQQLQLEDYFDGFVVSCQTGARKPEPAAYRAFCERVGREPSGCLLIDDREVNVAGAEQAGMSALLFREVAQLKGDLAARGLI
jgi:HAD superfamily hydrolase (TIGR01509 family)